MSVLLNSFFQSHMQSPFEGHGNAALAINVWCVWVSLKAVGEKLLVVKNLLLTLFGFALWRAEEVAMLDVAMAELTFT